MNDLLKHWTPSRLKCARYLLTLLESLWLCLGVMITVVGGARSVMVIVVGNGHGDTSSNPELD